MVYPGHVLFVCTSAGEYLSWSHNLSAVNGEHGGHSSLLSVDFGLCRYNPRNGMILSCDANCLFLVTGLMKQGQLFRNEIGPKWYDWTVTAQEGNWASLSALCMAFFLSWRQDRQENFSFCMIPLQDRKTAIMFQGSVACFGEKRFWLLWCTLGRWSPGLHGLHWGNKQELRQQYRTWPERPCFRCHHHSVMSFKETLLFNYLNFV